MKDYQKYKPTIDKRYISYLVCYSSFSNTIKNEKNLSFPKESVVLAEGFFFPYS